MNCFSIWGASSPARGLDLNDPSMSDKRRHFIESWAYGDLRARASVLSERWQNVSVEAALECLIE